VLSEHNARVLVLAVLDRQHHEVEPQFQSQLSVEFRLRWAGRRIRRCAVPGSDVVVSSTMGSLTRMIMRSEPAYQVLKAALTVMRSRASCR
jgi:NAD(P)-dependent dehydrogenase (short-subunit alcohol dehydrogenase family)